MALTLVEDVSEGGMNQGDLVKVLENVRDVLNEIQTAHATWRTVVGDNKALLNQVRAVVNYLPLGNPAFAISTNFDVKNANAIAYLNGGTLKTFGANTNFDTGTTATLPTTKWGVAVLSINSSGAAVLTWFNGVANAGYASEALAIAAITAPAATDTVLGYVTVQAAGSTWTPGTDALTTGTGGTPANATNYYNLINPNALLIGAAISSSPPAALTNSTAIKLTAG